ncbi:hypothetical protein [Streptomyces sp. NBC_00354]|uniref:hypothetical protein n=1 Tax=Streptomyces sp. NBC_00354 TaxID=2975723 RepID=UPI002E26A4AB
MVAWIAEVATEPLVLDPADRAAERETNTWWLGRGPDDGSLSAGEVTAAFERTAAALGTRVRDLGHRGPATFYVWHDEQAGQLRCSTASLPAHALPFGGAYAVTDALTPIVEAYLSDTTPGFVPWTELQEPESPESDETPDPLEPPLLVWARDLGPRP